MDRFDNPFPRNGCVPVAFAYAAGWGADEARLLAWYAEDAGIYNRRSHLGHAQHPSAFRLWARLAGLLDIRWCTHEGTLGWFLQNTGAAGTWLVFTSGHVQCVKDGQAYGYYKLRSRVRLAVLVCTIEKSPTSRRNGEEKEE